MQIKTTIRCYLIPNILTKIEKTPSANKDEKKEVSRAAGWGRKCSTLEKGCKVKLTVTIWPRKFHSWLFFFSGEINFNII